MAPQPKALRLLFLNARPGPRLGEALRRADFTVHYDTVPQPMPELDLVVWRAPKFASIDDVLEAVTRLRATYPTAWIALICSKSRLEEAEFCRRLVECDAKDDVWTVGSWEALFWLALQRAQRESRLRAELTEHAHADTAELQARSQALVSQLENNLQLASHIQRSILPQVYPEIPGVKLAAKYLPSEALGGDYFDVFEFGDRKRFGILLADSKTHGMAAALLSALLKVRLDEMKDRFPDSKSLLVHLHTELAEIPPTERASLSVLYGIFDRSALTFDFTVAGHLHPVLWRKHGFIEIDHTPTPALGEGGPARFVEVSVQLRPGDLLLLHTDGLSRLLPNEKLAKLLGQKGATPDPIEVQQELLGIVDQHRAQTPLADDITIVQLAVAERALYLHSRKP